ncbi:hypothetical protein C8R47DRAFT_1111182, partial [Mycena vitilis]
MQATREPRSSTEEASANELRRESAQAPQDEVSEYPDLTACLQLVLSACGLTCASQDITVLREGQDMGRQIVFNVANTWIIRLFELHDGYRQPAAFLASVLSALEHAGAPCEHIRYHGVVPDTPFHYTVTKFVRGIPLTDELCKTPEVQLQIRALCRVLRDLDLERPDTIGTVEDYMRPVLDKLHTKLSRVSKETLEDVGPLAPLSAFRDLQMVVSHRDLAPENIICALEPSASVSVIDWEFCAYVPEVYVARELRSWGKTFLEGSGYGPYPELLIWTTMMCFVSEDYEDEAFEQNVRIVLTA